MRAIDSAHLGDCVPGDDEVLGNRSAQIVDAADLKTRDVAAVHDRRGWKSGNPNPHLRRPYGNARHNSLENMMREATTLCPKQY